MSKRMLTLMIIAPLVVIFAACAALKLPGSAPAANQSQPNGNNFSFANQPLENKLAIGTLKLEGTPQAITADEAKNLLPLWKALKTLNGSNNASTTEVQALYKQIEAVLTPDQVNTIKNLSLTGPDIQALMKQYNIQAPQGGFANLSPSERATRVAQFQSQNGGAGGNGGNRTGGTGGGGGGFGGGGGGFFAPGGANPGQGNVQRTPNPNRAQRAGRGGMNFLFLDTVIKLLQQKAGA